MRPNAVKQPADQPNTQTKYISNQNNIIIDIPKKIRLCCIPL
jgi:hypothetical protein